ncbi:MAG: hypothetical protein EOP00_01415 [Pedobacter sp.]|nr:MAG: hypothetical protein EOP00_01415 [Pedobacter sp.]
MINYLRKKVVNWPNASISIMGGIAAFGCYTCMYAFRKAFAAGTFDNSSFFGIDYKVCLIIAQMLGYTFSKFYGIKFISQNGKSNRAKYILMLIGIAWLALLGFALIPAPYNIAMLLLNGFPLGMIWGLVFSYLEGRRTTEFMGALMSISLVFAAGFVKTIARELMSVFAVNEFWMPFATGLVFVLPLLAFVLCLELIPEPDEQDKINRTERIAMDGAQRRKFFLNFMPGILLTLIIYGLLTCMRDMRDNFEVEIWNGLGIKNNTIYAKIDTIISVLVLGVMALLILVKDNLKAFSLVHYLIIIGCMLIGLSTIAFNMGYIKPIIWMTLVGMGLYLAYIPYHAIFFERMIASLHYKSNVGFLIYISDSIGYLGSFSILMFHQFATERNSWASFFNQCLIIVAVVTTICSVLSLIYFLRKVKQRAITTQKIAEEQSILAAR